MTISRQYIEKDGILIFDSDLDNRSTYDARHLEALKKAESTHFWFKSRQTKICRTFQQLIPKNTSILEIGGGTGYIAEKLLQLGYCVEMGDIHLNGLLYAKKRGIKKLYQFDLFYPPFQNRYDVICLFDVLEHIKGEQQALECIKTMLKPNGKIILTVPAHQWLWNRDDAIAGHERRYTKKHLEKMFLAAGMRPIRIQYFFLSILPLLVLRKWINKDNKTSVKNEESVSFSIHPLFNRILLGLNKAELYFEKFLPNIAGGSLLAVAEYAQSSLDNR